MKTPFTEPFHGTSKSMPHYPGPTTTGADRPEEVSE